MVNNQLDESRRPNLQTYYDTLQISRAADESVVRAAYRTLSQRFHPDKHQPDQQSWANEQMQRLNEAYAVLSDSERRNAYDVALAAAEGKASNRSQFSQPQSKTSASGSQTVPGNRDSSTLPDSGLTQRLNEWAERQEAKTAKYERDNKYRWEFAYCFGIVIVGSYFLAEGWLKRSAPAMADLGAMNLLTSPFFLGQMTAAFMLLVPAAILGWCAGWIFRVPMPRRFVLAGQAAFLWLLVLILGPTLGSIFG